MITIPDLQTALLDLLHETRDADIRLIIGGGFGVYLKTEHVRESGARTLLGKWPEPRSTNDLDLFLRPELLIHSEKLEPMTKAISELGYQVVPGAEKYQFVKPGPGGVEAGSIKIDILTGPKGHFEGTSVKTNGRRAKPKPSVGIHAHVVEEATTLEEGLLEKKIAGKLSSGEAWRAGIFLPHPYTFLMMKLFAFRDQYKDDARDFGRHHVLDLYTIMATTIESEWQYGLELRDTHGSEPCVQEAGSLVSQHFSAIDNWGLIRLRESPYYRSELQLNEFMSAMKELFPEKGKAA